MKSALQFHLSLAMVLFLANSCVGAPPPASPESSAQPPAQTVEKPAAVEIPEPVEVPESVTDAEKAAADGITGEQASLSAPLAEADPAPPAASPSPVPASPGAGTAPTTATAVAVAKPEQKPASPQPAPKPAAPVSAPPSSTATKPPAPANPPAQAAAASQEKPKQVGEVVYAEGKVSVHRAGKTITLLDIGDVVYAYDVVMTGPASLAQVDLGAGRPGGAFIRLSENTAFYFDTKELSAEQRRTVLQLLSGSIAVKVEKLANGSFSTVSDTAVLGVRGTEFVVDTIPDGSILVTCIEGAVAIQGPEGQKATAQPGKAVAGREAGLETANIPVSELARFRNGWRKDTFTGFADQAVQYSSGYAATLDSRRAAFDTALAGLRSQEATLRLWREARASGREPRFTEWTAEKKSVGSILFENLKALFVLERPYYRLLELKSLHDSGIGVGTLKDGRTTAEFFSRFDARYGSLADGMAAVREALLLFSWVSAGSPLGDFFGAKAETLGSGALFLDGGGW